MAKFYVTFGDGSPYKNMYVEVHADSEEEVHRVMRDAHGVKWSHVYQDGFEEQIRRYGLRRLCIMKPNPVNKIHRIVIEPHHLDQTP